MVSEWLPQHPVNLTDALRVQVYYRSNSALAGTITLTLAGCHAHQPITNLVTNGFTRTFTGFGLQTTLTMPSIP